MRQPPFILALAIVVPAATAPAGENTPDDYPVSACGTLAKDELYDCIVFEPYFGHGSYLLDHWGDFQVGDEVHVAGTATHDCFTFCDYYACIVGAEVTRCDKGTTGDLDGDGDVDGDDLALLLGQWGSCPICIIGPCPCLGDLNRDATVNGLDLAILLAAWGHADPV